MLTQLFSFKIHDIATLGAGGKFHIKHAQKQQTQVEDKCYTILASSHVSHNDH